MEHAKEMELRELLGLYFEGGTTLVQERRLRELLAGDGVPADLRHAAVMFGFFAAAASEGMRKEAEATRKESLPPAGTAGGTAPEEARATGAAAKMANATDTPGDITAVRKPRRRLGLLCSLVSAAAIVVFAVTMTLKTTGGGNMPQVYCYVDGLPVTDLEFAARQAEMAVRILEGNMRASASGLEAAGKVGMPVERMAMEPGGAE